MTVTPHAVISLSLSSKLMVAILLLMCVAMLDAAGGPVIGATKWSRIDGMRKPHPCAQPIGPPDGSMDANYFRPVCAIYCEIAPP